MADKKIGDLPRAVSVNDASLLVMEQQGEALSVTGKLIGDFVRESAAADVQRAVDAADAAESAAQGVNTYADAAAQSATDAENARQAIENMIVEAITKAGGEPPTVSKELVNGVVKLVFGLPAGDKGDKGDPGNSIQSIERTNGTGAPGTTDTYTITLTDGSTTEFYVYNGRDAMGAGDMTSSVYDPQGKATDIFAYVDAKVKDIDPDVTADEVTFSDGETFQQKYDKGELNGSPATINGVNALEITAGDGIKIMLGETTFPGGTTTLTSMKISADAETDPTIPAWAKEAVKPTYTAEEVGAAASSHNQAASTITAGTFAGQVVANSSGQTPATSLLRNSKLVSTETDPTVNGEIYWVYG